MDIENKPLKARLSHGLAYIAVFSPALISVTFLTLMYFRIRALTPSITEFPVRGIDVSHHNGEIDWDRVALQGIKFAYIKAIQTI